MTASFERLCLIGVGLIGASIAQAARWKNAAREIVLYDASEDVRRRARELNLADYVLDNPVDAVAGADGVILCVPVRAMMDVVCAIKDHLAPGAVVSDVGSVKASVIRDCAALLPKQVDFVPGHPIAGLEYSGPEAGFPTLFVNHWCILTPQPATKPEALVRVKGFWEALGARVALMTPEQHDQTLALTSHLPHLLAYGIVYAVACAEFANADVIKFSAGGFRDFTRIAASDPIMWRDIFLSNDVAVLESIDHFQNQLAMLREMIQKRDASGLEKVFSETRAVRRMIIEAGQDVDLPDFARPRAVEAQD